MGLKGVTFYRLRHSFKTLGKNARDRESLDLMMGHRDAFVGRINEKLDSLNPAVTNLLGQGRRSFCSTPAILICRD